KLSVQLLEGFLTVFCAGERTLHTDDAELRNGLLRRGAKAGAQQRCHRNQTASNYHVLPIFLFLSLILYLSSHTRSMPGPHQIRMSVLQRSGTKNAFRSMEWVPQTPPAKPLPQTSHCSGKTTDRLL